ncbi:glycerate kinase type-2 family protein [Oceanisphaera sp. KMM 10153]|uniref:glycerate kinase type-2 family protein n=1 Tax=Oceanisphaera submarina TaxID=3390193 RepID=UPI003974A823
MDIHPKELLQQLFNSAVAAALPKGNLAEYLPKNTRQKAVVIGAGKAAASMAAELDAIWEGELSGMVVTRYDHGAPCERIEIIEAAHPVPDDAGERVGRRMLELVSALGEDDLVICLLSGGGSSLLSLPAPGMTLSDKQSINKALLKSGAAIDEMNCVRKHLSGIKGGRLAAATYPARLIALGISDVPGDEPTVIASGPTVADPTTSAQALSILDSYGIEVGEHVRSWLQNPESETVKPGDERLSKAEFHMIATPQDALDAAAAKARELNITPLVLGDCIEGESREVAKVHAAIAKQIQKCGQPIPAPCVILSGGETTVTIKGNGRGGRNSEFTLSLFNELKGQAGIYALAADTDGIDGVEDNAGAMITPELFAQAEAAGLKAEDYLANNDSYSFFHQLNALVETGPTRTNVNDFRAILVLPK